MAKKTYNSPFFFTLNPGEGTVIDITNSQGTSGYDSQWTFSGIDQATLNLIELNCDDFDLKAMDTDGDYIITQAEFQVWYDAHQPW